MITLKRDTLSFTFPESAKQVRLLVERQIQKIASQLPPSWDRIDLMAAIEANPKFNQLTPSAQETARAKIHTWTPAHVEGYLQEFALKLGGLNTDAFTELIIKFQRTVRIPDDGNAYSPPAASDQLPIRSVDDFPAPLPASWLKHGGVIIPLRPSEDLCIWFSSRYRFAVKIAVGRTNALTGMTWNPDLRKTPQDYLLAPGPPGYYGDGVTLRFVAVPPGSRFSAEQNLADKEDFGGIQLLAVPMSAESYYRDEGAFFLPRTIDEFFSNMLFAPIISAKLAEMERQSDPGVESSSREWLTADGMEPGPDGRMRQEIFQDPYGFTEWDQTQTVRCLVHPCDASGWRQITGTNPPHPPFIAEDYKGAGTPWCDDYQDQRRAHVEDLLSLPQQTINSAGRQQAARIREFLGNP